MQSKGPLFFYGNLTLHVAAACPENRVGFLKSTGVIEKDYMFHNRIRIGIKSAGQFIYS